MISIISVMVDRWKGSFKFRKKQTQSNRLEQELDKLDEMYSEPISDTMRGYKQAIADVKQIISQLQPPK